MGRLILIILAAIVITAILYSIMYKLSPFKDGRVKLGMIQRMLCWFIVLYTPVQLMVLLAAGQYMPLLNPKEHALFAGLFTSSHALLAVMGIVVSKYFHQRNKAAMTLMVLNAATAIFYTMSAIILLMAM
jgi:small-conductance mechanosensitive channel